MDDLRLLALDLLESASVALVTTIDGDGMPNSRAMLNLRHRTLFPDLLARDGFTTFLTTNIVEDPAIKCRIRMADWLRYYPGGWDDPDHTLLRLRPSRIKYYHQMRHASFTADADASFAGEAA